MKSQNEYNPNLESSQTNRLLATIMFTNVREVSLYTLGCSPYIQLRPISWINPELGLEHAIFNRKFYFKYW